MSSSRCGAVMRCFTSTRLVKLFSNGMMYAVNRKVVLAFLFYDMLVSAGTTWLFFEFPEIPRLGVVPNEKYTRLIGIYRGTTVFFGMLAVFFRRYGSVKHFFGCFILNWLLLVIFLIPTFSGRLVCSCEFGTWEQCNVVQRFAEDKLRLNYVPVPSHVTEDEIWEAYPGNRMLIEKPPEALTAPSLLQMRETSWETTTAVHQPVLHRYPKRVYGRLNLEPDDRFAEDNEPSLMEEINKTLPEEAEEEALESLQPAAIEALVKNKSGLQVGHEHQLQNDSVTAADPVQLQGHHSREDAEGAEAGEDLETCQRELISDLDLDEENGDDDGSNSSSLLQEAQRSRTFNLSSPEMNVLSEEMTSEILDDIKQDVQKSVEHYITELCNRMGKLRVTPFAAQAGQAAALPEAEGAAVISQRTVLHPVSGCIACGIDFCAGDVRQLESSDDVEAGKEIGTPLPEWGCDRLRGKPLEVLRNAETNATYAVEQVDVLEKPIATLAEVTNAKKPLTAVAKSANWRRLEGVVKKLNTQKQWSEIQQSELQRLSVKKGLDKLKLFYDSSCRCEDSHSCRIWTSGADTTHWCWLDVGTLHNCRRDGIQILEDRNGRAWSTDLCNKRQCQCAGLGMVATTYRPMNDITDPELNQSAMNYGSHCKKWKEADPLPWCYVHFDTSCVERIRKRAPNAKNTVFPEGLPYMFSSWKACESKRNNLGESAGGRLFRAKAICENVQLAHQTVLWIQFVLTIPMFVVMYYFVSNRCGDTFIVEDHFVAMSSDSEDESGAGDEVNRNDSFVAGQSLDADGPGRRKAEAVDDDDSDG
eukprot:gb/GFBE01010685.1/.p1 GENE.gb/GFBE01010685.1/~~gb/GFBE01010685.1/.p1  ORF type:complete len:813 (+),score=153.78 gb/GFBE01010685.1/:1-2439(+)